MDASCSPSGRSSSNSNNVYNNPSSISASHALASTSDPSIAAFQVNTNIKINTNDQVTRPVSPSYLSTPPSSSPPSSLPIFERCQTPMPSWSSPLPQPPSSSTARRSSLVNEQPPGGGGLDQGQAQGRSSPWKNGWRKDVVSSHFESSTLAGAGGGSVPMTALSNSLPQHPHGSSGQQNFHSSRSAVDDETTSREGLAHSHQGVIMAFAGPGAGPGEGAGAGTGASFSLGPGMASNNDEDASSSTGPRAERLWIRLTRMMRPLVSQSLVSRIYSRRPQFSNIGSSSWSVVRYTHKQRHLSFLRPRDIRRGWDGIATRSKKGSYLLSCSQSRHT